MMRTLVVVFSVFCVATVTTAVIAAGVLWYRGNLNASTIQDIRFALSGQDRNADVDEEPIDRTQPVIQDVVDQRAKRIFELDTREQELTLLKEMVSASADALTAERQEFENTKKTFEERLATLNQSISSEATGQSRGVLLAMSPADAVANLMQLTLEQNVVLLKGMTERSIGKLLQEFGRSNDPQVARRGQEIFEALSQGEPTISPIQDAEQSLTAAEGTTAK